MLGGSSSMNAMMWVRGFAADYDEWAEPCRSRELETSPTSRSTSRTIESAARCHLAAAQPAQLDRGMADRVRECGYPVENPIVLRRKVSARPRVTQRRGARWSTADAYLKPALRGRT